MNAGHQKARAAEWAIGVASTGNKQVAIDFELSDGKEHITWYGSLSEAAFDRTIESLRYCGWEGDDLSNLAGLDKNEVSLDIGWDDYGGQNRLKVNWVNRVGGVAMKDQLAGDELRAFAAQMKSRIAAIGKTPKPRQQQMRTDPPPRRQGGDRPEDYGIPSGGKGGNDDLPF